MSERRQTPRLRALKSARIALSRGGAIDCLVRNRSAAGACLEVASPVGIPDIFDLVVDTDNTAQHCRVAWRSANRIGVKFD